MIICCNIKFEDIVFFYSIINKNKTFVEKKNGKWDFADTQILLRFNFAEGSSLYKTLTCVNMLNSLKFKISLSSRPLMKKVLKSISGRL